MICQVFVESQIGIYISQVVSQGRRMLSCKTIATQRDYLFFIMMSNIFWLTCVVAVPWMVWHVLGCRDVFFRKCRRVTEIALPTEDLKSTLRGQIIRVPDLTKLFTHWPATRISSHLNELRLIHDGKVLEWFPDEKVRKKMMGIDVPLFAAM
jgi:hypothetical protein